MAGLQPPRRRQPRVSRQPAGRRADGPDLRQPRRRERPARPAAHRPGRAPDLCPHGDGRRRNRGPHRWRPHRGQGTRQRQRQTAGAGARSRRCGRARPGLAKPHQPWCGPRHRQQRHRGRMDHPPHPVGQRLLPPAVHLRLGAGKKPRRGLAVATRWHQGGRHASGCGRPVHPLHAHHDRCRHGDEDGPGLPRDCRTLPPRSRILQPDLCPRLVQTDPPRHGPQGPLHRPRSARRRPDLARPRARWPHRLRRDRCQGTHCRSRLAGGRPGGHRVGQRPHLAGLGHARRCQRCPHPPGSPERLGRQRARAPGPRAGGVRTDCRRHRSQRGRRDRAGGQPGH